MLNNNIFFCVKEDDTVVCFLETPIMGSCGHKWQPEVHLPSGFPGEMLDQAIERLDYFLTHSRACGKCYHPPTLNDA